MRVIGFDDPALHLALAAVGTMGTMFIIVPLVLDAPHLAKAVVFIVEVVGTAFALFNRKQ